MTSLYVNIEVPGLLLCLILPLAAEAAKETGKNIRFRIIHCRRLLDVYMCNIKDLGFRYTFLDTCRLLFCVQGGLEALKEIVWASVIGSR